MATYKLLGVRYEWFDFLGMGEWRLSPRREDIPEQYQGSFSIDTSNTHEALVNLIDGNADIILTHRTLSSDEKAHADEAGVTLMETPIASDAFVFIVNKNNPVKSLTVEQIQKSTRKRSPTGRRSAGVTRRWRFSPGRAIRAARRFSGRW